MMSEKTIESERMTTDELKEMLKDKLCRISGSGDVSVFDAMKLVKKAIDMSVDATERVISERSLKGQGEARPFNARVSCTATFVRCDSEIIHLPGTEIRTSGDIMLECLYNLLKDDSEQLAEKLNDLVDTEERITLYLKAVELGTGRGKDSNIVYEIQKAERTS